MVRVLRQLLPELVLFGLLALLLGLHLGDLSPNGLGEIGLLTHWAEGVPTTLFPPHPFPPIPPSFNGWMFGLGGVISVLLFGYTLFAGHLLPYMYTLGCVVAVYGLAYSVFEHRLTAILSSLVFGLSLATFWSSHQTSPEPLWTLVILITSIFFWGALQRLQRGRLKKWEIRDRALQLGSIFGLQLLLVPTPLCWVPWAILVTQALIQKRHLGQESLLFSLAKHPWGLLFPGFILALWGIGQLLQSLWLGDYPNPSPMLQGGFSNFNGIALWEHLLQAFKSALILTMPWNVFLVFHGVSAAAQGIKPLLKRQSDRSYVDRAPDNPHRSAYWFLGTMMVLYFILGMVLSVFDHGQSAVHLGGYLLAAWAPAAIWIGHQLTRLFEGDQPVWLHFMVVDVFTLLYFFAAVAFTVILFLDLSPQYLGGNWFLPGPSFISESDFSKSGELSIQFSVPIWKLWLSAWAFVYLMGGMILLSGRIFLLPVLSWGGLFGTLAIHFVLIFSLLLPLVHGNTVQQFYQATQSIAPKGTPIFVMGRSPELVTLPAFVESPDSRITHWDSVLRVFRRPYDLAHWLYPQTKPVVGILDKSAYYQLPPRDRQYLKIKSVFKASAYHTPFWSFVPGSMDSAFPQKSGYQYIEPTVLYQVQYQPIPQLEIPTDPDMGPLGETVGGTDSPNPL